MTTMLDLGSGAVLVGVAFTRYLAAYVSDSCIPFQIDHRGHGFDMFGEKGGLGFRSS